jgi:hypothetical protein
VAEVKNYGLSGVHRTLQLGKQGPVLVGNADTDSFTVTLQDSSTLTTMGGANASSPEHFVTKAQLDTVYTEAQFLANVNYNDSSPISLGTISSGTKTIITTFEVETTFNGNAVVTVGTGSNSSLLMSDNYAEIEVAGSYQTINVLDFPSNTALNIYVTQGGATQGAGNILVSVVDGPVVNGTPGGGGGGNANTGNITFNGNNIGSTGNIVEISASEYVELSSNDNYVWADNQGVHIEVNTGEGGNEFVFEHGNGTSKLRLPSGGDIVDSSGNSVLGGGGSGISLGDLSVTSNSPSGNGSLTYNNSTGVFTFTPADTTGGAVLGNIITNTDGSSTYSVSVGTDGVITMTTARGGLEFGALPEPGGPTHFHIMKPASENGSGGSDLYFGDDYNYVLQRPDAYNGNPAYGVEIGTNDNDGGDQHVWRFGTDGVLTLPANGDIVDSNGDSVLGGGSGGGGTSLPPYKGFRAHYGRMWNNNDDPNGPINKIVIYKDTVTPSSTIDVSTESDDFTVTGLSGSDVVAMLVIIGEDIDQTPTTELKTFAESIIDNVILDEGVEGDINSINSMRTAFYDNFNTFSATITDRKANLEFFDVNNQFSISPQYTTGDGAGFSGISYNMDNDTLDLGSWGQGAPNTHEVNDVHVIPGNTIQDADGNYLLTPDNDVTVTITAVSGGAILNYTVTGTLPRPAVIWPSYEIGDGGDDEYDDGNHINTNLDTNISYNSGNVVTNSSAFGGGEYVVTYQDSIFGVFATNAAINSISTDGGSGFDGDGIADTGSLYGDAGGESPVIATWTNPNDNVWRIETYNGGAAVSYDGGDNDANWFDIANHSSGDSDFRGAIIQYHAFVQGEGTIVGTIHLSNDYTQEAATHTEHLSGNDNLQFVTLWECNGERGRLYFKMTNGNSEDVMIQWTSTVFYGQESDD